MTKKQEEKAQQSDETWKALMDQKVDTIISNVTEMNSRLKEDYVTKDQVALLHDRQGRIEKIVNAVIMAIVVAFIGLIFSIFKTK